MKRIYGPLAVVAGQPPSLSELVSPALSKRPAGISCPNAHLKDSDSRALAKERSAVSSHEDFLRNYQSQIEVGPT
ncbi:hypothetical protein NEOLEDRAFT_1139411, partial [Neolentinus lepideus HHB14362 ss-1]